jgi:sulfatase modifying factor 1
MGEDCTPGSSNIFVGTRAGQSRIDNGLSTELLWIPPGEFVMGSPMDEKDRSDDEDQVHVTLTDGFWLGRHAVTQSEWQRVMQTIPWHRKHYVQESNDYPATCVSWNDARTFCDELTKQERAAGRLPSGRQYLLPTEAQWEYACRGGTTSRFSYGDNDSDLSDYAWWGGIVGNGNATSEQHAHPVGQKKANPFGLKDMHGNIWEWCRDVYSDKLPGGVNPEALAGGPFRVKRGGSWGGVARLCRSANRRGLVQSGTSDEGDGFVGFRLALSLFGNRDLRRA